MANMTYKKLLQQLLTMDEARLDDNITVYMSEEDEYHPVTDILCATDNDDVLDGGHLYLGVIA